MTLKQAHEIQRKELWSLRAENARLKKQSAGLFPNEERDALKSKIRQLEQDVKQSSERTASDRANIKRLKDQCFDLEMEVLELKDRIASLQEDVDFWRQRAEKAEEEVSELNGIKAKLEKKLNTNFENSSLPSSAQPYRKNVPNSRKPSGKKPGGQPGHEAHSASRLSTTMTPVYIPAPEEFQNNPNFYPTGKNVTKQVIDVQFYVIARDYTTPEYRNRATGARVHAPFPAGVVNEVNYGPSLKAFAFLLNNYYNVSIAKTKQCIEDITKGIVSLSTGMICNLAAEFSAATEQERQKIFSSLHHSDVLYSDATVSNVNGKHKAVFVCTNKEEVLYFHLDHKGHKGLDETPLKDFTGTTVHDHDRSFYAYGKKHQECLAHVLRYLVGAKENEPHLTWHEEMHKLLQEMIHTAKTNKEQGEKIPKEKVRELTGRYDDILILAEKEYKQHPPNKYYRDGYNLQKRLREYKDAHLYFLSHPDVDYTNNVSERALRKVKRKLKQATVFRSDAGGQHICAALSFIETRRSQNQNIFNHVEMVFAK